MLHDSQNADTIITDKFANLVIGYRAFRSGRGNLMLHIIVNGEKRYELGPFSNKEERQILLNKLRDTVAKWGGDTTRVW